MSVKINKPKGLDVSNQKVYLCCTLKNAPRMTRKKMIASAPKYFLFMEGFGFLAEHQDLSGVKFADKTEDAQQFAVGFDNPADKILSWNATFKVAKGSAGNFQTINA